MNLLQELLNSINDNKNLSTQKEMLLNVCQKTEKLTTKKGNGGILRADGNFIIEERSKKLLDSDYPLWIYIFSENASANFPEGYYNVQKVGNSYRFDQILLGDQFHLDGH